MQKQISFRQYCIMDLLMMTGLLVIAEIVIHMAVTNWFPSQLYMISAVGIIVTLVLMRWNALAAVPAFAGGIVYGLLYHGTFKQVLIYGIGNLLAVVLVLPMKKIGKEKIQHTHWLALLLGACVCLLMQTGRMIVAMIMGYEFSSAAGFITTDILSTVFTLVVTWIVCRVDGLFEDQKHYVLRIKREQEERRE